MTWTEWHRILRPILTTLALAVFAVGCDQIREFIAPSPPEAEFVHGIVLKVDGEDYYLAGAPDGPNGAIDIPGHYWVITDSNQLTGKHYNAGPFDAPQWWSSDAADGALLYMVDAIIDTWSEAKAQQYASQGFIHYHEMVRVSDGALHPNKVVWLRHTAMMSFTLDGGPHPEAAHKVKPGVDYEFLPNGSQPYPAELIVSSMFHVLIENISSAYRFTSSGVFNTPVGAAGPGPAGPGSAYEFSATAGPGSNLSFATMFVHSNDLFYSPGEMGIPLFDAGGIPITGDVTSQIMLWDAGTEVNEEPGVGPNQAPRQAGPDTGPDENGVVQLVNDGFVYPNVSDAIRVTLTWISDTDLRVLIENIASDDSVILAPGVWVVHAPDDAPLFTSGQPDSGIGLEAVAEDGSPSDLAMALESETGVTTILAPGVWVVHTSDGPLFTSGQPDRGMGLEALAEDGSPGNLAAAVTGATAVTSSDVFSVPVGAAGPGPAGPGDAYEFTVSADPGTYLSFATMFVHSNDLFYAPSEMGIALFDAGGMPTTGDITSQIMLWDAGTEVNEAPGAGPNQAPRQAGANTGVDENGVVQLVNDGFSYPNTTDTIRVTISLKQ